MTIENLYRRMLLIRRFEEKVKQLLSIPDKWNVVAVVSFGYLAEKPQPKSKKPVEEIVSSNEFQMHTLARCSETQMFVKLRFESLRAMLEEFNPDSIWIFYVGPSATICFHFQNGSVSC